MAEAVARPEPVASESPFQQTVPGGQSSTGFADHRWLTMRQANELGAKVRAGEHASMVVFWKFPEKKPSNDESEEDPRSAPVLRYYNVFNVEQIEGLNLPESPGSPNLSDNERNRRAELLIGSMPNPPFIEERGTEAWYLPERDIVRVPKLESFSTADAYYGTLLHELVHSTGHQTRLNRAGVMGAIHFGSEQYSREELVAELGSAFCCAVLGLDNSLTENTASYIGGWLKSLRSDPKAVVIAAGQAQKAADHIRGISYL